MVGWVLAQHNQTAASTFRNGTGCTACTGNADGAAKACLEVLTDLNNRYALDGHSPPSIGGLMGCMGLFEKPPAGAGSVGIRALLQKRGLKRKYIALGTRSLH